MTKGLKKGGAVATGLLHLLNGANGPVQTAKTVSGCSSPCATAPPFSRHYFLRRSVVTCSEMYLTPWTSRSRHCLSFSLLCACGCRIEQE